MDPVGHPQKLETVLICLKLSSSEVAAEGGIHSHDERYLEGSWSR